MSPFPIRKNSEEIPMSNEFVKEPVMAQDFYNLFPFIEHLFGLNEGDKSEKNNLKEIWLHSSSVGDNTMQIGESIDKKKVESLKSKGLLSGVGDRYRLTEKGSKLLRDAILNDEQSSFTKEASSKMISKSSYDFGDYVLVKVQNPEKFGARYVNVKKSVFAKKNLQPISMNEYKIATTNEDGSYKKLSEYSDYELIQVLHLAKRITDNANKIILAGNVIGNVPVHKIKNFAVKILEELNNRK